MPLGADDGMKQPCAVNLHNLVTVAQGHIGKRIAQLSETRMQDVCRAMAFALGCDGMA